MKMDRLFYILGLLILFYWINQYLGSKNGSYEEFANSKKKLKVNVHKVSSNQFYDNLYTLEKEYLQKPFPLKKNSGKSQFFCLF
jgi:hypothetical protein